MSEPLLTTTDGTILDGRARWQAAIDRRQPSLGCIEYDLTEEEALEFLLAKHHTSEGLNDFCRIVVALRLEPYYRARTPRRPAAGGANTLSSNLTKVGRKDVRADIARVAGASAGNVTKVKQLLKTAIPEAHFAIRGLLHEAALEADEDPDRLSYLHAVRVVRRKMAQAAAIPPSGQTQVP